MNRICLLACLVVILSFTACKKKIEQKTRYRAVPGAKAKGAPPVQGSSIHWHVPSTWQKQSADDGITGMSYSLGNLQLTITPLEGDAGGVEANVQRWRTQAGLPPFSAEELKSSITQFATGAGPAQIVKVATAATAPKQIFGAMLSHGGTTWFVKMTGPVADLDDARWQEFQAILKAAHPGGSH